MFLESVLKSFHWIAQRLTGLDDWWAWRIYSKFWKPKKAYDIVLATIPDPASAEIARQIAQSCNAHLVVDYRDPWQDLPEKDPLKKKYGERYLERSFLIEKLWQSESSLITTVSPEITNMLVSSNPTLNVMTVPQGYDPSSRVRPAEVLIPGILYAGSLAYGRDLSPILAALEELNNTNDTPIEFHYCGPHSSIAVSQVRESGYRGTFCDHGQISRTDARQLSSSVLANLIAISPSYEYAYPGKLFELIECSRPLLVLAEFSCPTTNLVDRYNQPASFLFEFSPI